ncbi:uncharacterized protein LOC110692395 [Chenopodium quinoa]|uniref:uncharacterized protein LOC110692395 n=1 Tax=Chenopodium quinoa TaxID=63459 RepID=UPI000B77AA46|nr:uncharacterized protein LOC110692395 [Chenopodium quinoa]
MSHDADTASRWPDIQNYARRMIRTLTRSEREAMPGVSQINLDRITSLLAEAMLRVDGLKAPLRKKKEEVRDAQKRATDLIDVCQYNSLMLEIHTKAREMKQEELIQQLTTAADTANKTAADRQLQIDQLKTDIQALKDAVKEKTGLKEEVTRLQGELDKTKNDLVKSKKDALDQLAAEQTRLVNENERDCEARMKMAWSMIHPETDYAFFDLRYKYATEVFDAQVLGLQQPASFEEWAGLGEEQTEGEVPGDGTQTQDAPNVGQGQQLEQQQRQTQQQQQQ